MKDLMSLAMEERMNLYNQALKIREKKGWGKYRISEKMDVSPSTIGSWIYEGRRPDRKPSGNPIEWEPTKSKELSYVIGVLYGDGCVYRSKHQYGIRLGVNDRKFAEEFKNSIEKIGLNPSIYKTEEQNKSPYIVSAYSKQFVSWFQGLNLIDSKQYYWGFKKQFVKGMYDSDGGLYIQNGKRSPRRVKVYIGNTNRNLLELIKKALSTLDIPSYISRLKEGGKRKASYSLSVSKLTDVVSFLIEIGSSIERKSLKRLREKYSKNKIEGIVNGQR